jgi:uncharacterized protein
MRSCDTNILFYACHSGCAEHLPAREYLQKVAADTDFLICELVLAELYVLLRNPKLVDKPMSSAEAAQVCRYFRENPSWGIIDYPGGLMDRIWVLSAAADFGYREIFDARLALTLRHHGVTEFATRNTAHFMRYGFEQLINPIDS